MGFQFQSVASLGPFLIDEFHLSYAQLGWLMGLYLLPGTVIALPGGLLGQRFGDRRVAVTGLALMAAGGALMAASPSFALACVGRAVSGVGGVLLNVLLAKMVADWFAGREISTAMGVMLTAWPAGVALAVAGLGLLASLTSWRQTVHATAAVAAVAAILMLALYRDAPAGGGSPPGRASLDLRLPRRALGLALVGGLAWVAFNAAFIAFVSFTPGLLMAAGATIGEAGLLVSVAIWVSLGSVPLGGWLADRLPRRHDLLIVIGCLACGLAIGALPVLHGPVVWSALAGLVAGLAPGAMMALLPRVLAPDQLATGFGVYYTVYYLGMAVTQPVAGAIRDRSGSPAAPIFCAAGLMAATVLGLGAFRLVQRGRPAAAGE